MNADEMHGPRFEIRFKVENRSPTKMQLPSFAIPNAPHFFYIS